MTTNNNKKSKDNLLEAIDKRIAKLQRDEADAVANYEAKKYPNYQHLLVQGAVIARSLRNELEEIRKLIIAEQERIVNEIRALDNETEPLIAPKCPYPTCEGGVVIEREDDEYHCTKCGSEINEYYVVFEGLKLIILNRIITEGKEKEGDSE